MRSEESAVLSRCDDQHNRQEHCGGKGLYYDRVNDFSNGSGSHFGYRRNRLEQTDKLRGQYRVQVQDRDNYDHVGKATDDNAWSNLVETLDCTNQRHLRTVERKKTLSSKRRDNVYDFRFVGRHSITRLLFDSM